MSFFKWKRLICCLIIFVNTKVIIYFKISDCFINLNGSIGFILISGIYHLLLIEPWLTMIGIFQYFDPKVCRIKCNSKFSILTNRNLIILLLNGTIISITYVFTRIFFTL
ncbi:hypothetical protein C1646_717904, partial [Rhizophagus diaphanus]